MVQRRSNTTPRYTQQERDPTPQDLTPEGLRRQFGGRRNIKPSNVMLQMPGGPERQVSLVQAVTQIRALGITKGREEEDKIKRANTQLCDADKQKRIIVAFLSAIRAPLRHLNAVGSVDRREGRHGEHPGCIFVTRLLVSIAKELKIACQVHTSRGGEGGHTFPYFPTAQVGLKRGDDPYSLDLDSLTNAKDLLLSKPQIETYYKKKDDLHQTKKRRMLADADKPENQPTDEVYRRAIAVIRATVTIKTRFASDGTPLPGNAQREVRVDAQDVLLDSSFKRALLVTRTGSLVKPANFVTNKLREHERRLTSSIAYPQPGTTPPRTDDEIRKSLAGRIANELSEPAETRQETLDALRQTYPGLQRPTPTSR